MDQDRLLQGSGQVVVEFVPQAGELFFQVLHLAAELLLPVSYGHIRRETMVSETMGEIPLLFVHIMSEFIEEFILDDELVLKMFSLRQKSTIRRSIDHFGQTIL